MSSFRGLSPYDWGDIVTSLVLRERLGIMKTPKEGVAVWRLDENRYAVGINRLIRYVGSLEECQRRADILSSKSDRNLQDRALLSAAAGHRSQ